MILQLCLTLLSPLKSSPDTMVEHLFVPESWQLLFAEINLSKKNVQISKTKSDYKNAKRSKFFYALLFGWASARTFVMTIRICTDQKTKTDH